MDPIAGLAGQGKDTRTPGMPLHPRCIVQHRARDMRMCCGVVVFGTRGFSRGYYTSVWPQSHDAKVHVRGVLAQRVCT